MAEPRNRYSAVSLVMHWATALAVLVQVLLISARDAIEGQAARELLIIHKSVGMTILVLTLARIGWRLAHPAIPMPASSPRWERLAARATHVLFYVALVSMPLTGWLAASAGGRDLSWFGLFQWPLLPIGGGREAAGRFMDLHGVVMKGIAETPVH
ncbi:hypothetical protein LTR94_025340 [Friedmanniomyces endolithicus]|nr:hypothetical protein LTR94_025340 [Friedmanniomyces endolithicus]